ncbi:UNVERIFIED_CONTAM: Dimethylnonatriene synthase [Sesamum radiatum]|uniref:Dimethylnonatriene synthase n=1 Tax=Sesamum radiatum TaxID=300843 RepID=A0AAW2THC7_SESRA
MQNVILGGFDTTSVHLTWLLSLLVNNKHVMNLARQEINDNVGNQRWVQESDINNLPYLQAIIKESLRLYPPLPLSIPHEAVEDCRLCGYLIPKGTLLFVNLWKLHRDPRFWPEPNRFMPERFLKGHAQGDEAGQQYEYIPFGMGRRSCPGTTFAMQVTSLTVARLIQGFDFATEGNEAVDMAEGIGIIMPRENPLEVLVTPRLPSQLYE